MAKIHRVSFYIVDPQGRFSNNEVTSLISSQFGSELAGTWPEQMHIDTCPTFEWEHGCPEDKHGCDLAHLAKHFVKQDEDRAGEVVVGGLYRHFKEGKHVTVIGVGRHSETQEQLVVYVCSNGIWARPIDMFLSKVDKEKYPDATQEYRFELVDDHYDLDTVSVCGVD